MTGAYGTGTAEVAEAAAAITAATAEGRLQDKRRRSGRRGHEALAAYLYLSPSLLFFLVFLVLPTFFAIFLSLSSWSGYDLTRIRFIGPQNFAHILNLNGGFVTPILTNTLLFALISVVLSVIASVAIAAFIEHLRFQGFWRFLYFLPVVATVVAVGNVWQMLYQPSGLINGILNALGQNSIGFLSDPKIALPSVAVAQAWSSIGVAVLILTAGMKAIDRNLYEAAEIDGANSWSSFWSITLPLLRPSLLFVFITQCIGGLQSFALIIVMTSGGPANSTDVAAYEMFQQAFKFGAWGTASAMALVLFVLIFAITLLQLWISRKTGGDEE